MSFCCVEYANACGVLSQGASESSPCLMQFQRRRLAAGGTVSNYCTSVSYQLQRIAAGAPSMCAVLASSMSESGKDAGVGKAAQ